MQKKLKKCIKRYKNNGITLIALVITIIILLILAGLSISALTGSGLFGKANDAVNKYGNAQNQENSILREYENYINVLNCSFFAMERILKKEEILKRRKISIII